MLSDQLVLRLLKRTVAKRQSDRNKLGYPFLEGDLESRKAARLKLLSNV